MTLTAVNGKQAKYDSGSENGNGNLTPTGVALGLHNSATAPVLSALDHRMSSVAALLSDDSSHSSPCLLPRYCSGMNQNVQLIKKKPLYLP